MVFGHAVDKTDKAYKLLIDKLSLPSQKPSRSKV